MTDDYGICVFRNYNNGGRITGVECTQADPTTLISHEILNNIRNEPNEFATLELAHPDTYEGSTVHFYCINRQVSYRIGKRTDGFGAAWEAELTQGEHALTATRPASPDKE